MAIVSTYDGQDGLTSYYENEFNSFVISEVIKTVPNRGATFISTIMPKIPMERSLFDVDDIKILSSSGTEPGFLQIFRASTKNIHDVKISLAGTTTLMTTLDDFEYATDTAIQSVYVSTNTQGLQIYSVSDMFYNGSKCAKIIFNKTKAPGTSLVGGYPTPQNWSNSRGISLYWNSILSGLNNTWRISITDNNSNVAYIDFNTLNINVWENKILNFESFTNISLIDLSLVKKISLTCMSCEASKWIYFDKLELIGESNIGQNIEVKLFDFGENANPTQLPANAMTLDEGIDYTICTIDDTKEIRTIHLHCGSHNINNSLVIGNYYGIFISKPDMGNCIIYGNSNQSYMSGKCYSIDSSNNLIEESSTVGFMCFAVSDCILKCIDIYTDGDPKLSKMYLYIIDERTGCNDFFAELHLRNNELHVDFKDTITERLPLDIDKHIYLYYEDAYNSEVNNIYIRYKIYHNEVEYYG